jgi:hypothetical protein
MAAKTSIVDFLGDKALVLPALLDDAIVGNERAKYVLSLLQMAASYAEHPQAEGAPSLKTDREACGIADTTFDCSVRESVSDGHGSFHIPGTHRLMAVLDDAMTAMLAPLSRRFERVGGFVRGVPSAVGAARQIATHNRRRYDQR